MRIYITGSNGFLAQKFCEIVVNQHSEIELLGVSKSENRNVYLKDDTFQQIDVTDFGQLKKSLDHFKPTHILHAAAITAVEGCEFDKELAYKTNVELTAFLAKYCIEKSIHMIFLSTDFVFDGINGPYSENDVTNPVNYYGETKVLAEQAILNSGVHCAILRTVLVYGAIPDASRSNLVLWAKSQLENDKPIKVVSDQWRMPTWVDDLANACLLVITMKANGIYHISGERMMSIEESVYILADTLDLRKDLISSIRAEDIGQDKNRPRRTGFILGKAFDVLGYQPTSYVNSLLYICEQLKKYGR